jgi:TonB family protein
MADRRIYARHTPAALTYVSAGDTNGGILLNVSEAGCALQLITPPPTMSDVSLELDLGSSLPRVLVAGKVIWADETGCTGVRFTDVSEGVRQTIRKFVESNPADPSLPEIGVELESKLGAGVLGNPVPVNGVSSDPDPLVLDDPLMALEPEPEPDEALFDSVQPQSFESRLKELSTGAAFVAIVDECRKLTGATAAALALLKGRDMLCRASSGKGAPPSGARLDITSERSFTAQCVSSGTALSCVDSQTDARVNAAVCQKLGIRSVTALPLKNEGTVVGVLEVFSPEKNAFRDEHIGELEHLGEVAVQFAVERNEVTLPPQSSAPWKAPAARPAAPPAPERPAFPSPAPTHPSPQFASSFTTAAAVAVAPAPAAPATAAATASPVFVRNEAAGSVKPEPVRAEPKAILPETSAPATPVVEQAKAAPAKVVDRSGPAPATTVAPIFVPPVRTTSTPTTVSKDPLAPPTKQVSKPEAPLQTPAAKTVSERLASMQAAAAPSVQLAKPTVDRASARPVVAPPVVRGPRKVDSPEPAIAEMPKTAAAKSTSALAPFSAGPSKAASPKAKHEELEVAPFAEDPTPVFAPHPTPAEFREQLFQSEPEASANKGPLMVGAAAIIVAVLGGGIWAYHARQSAAPAASVASVATPATTQAGSTPAASSSTAEDTAATPLTSSASKESASSKSSGSKPEAKTDKSEKSDKGASSKTADKSNTPSDAKKSTPEPQVIALAQSAGGHHGNTPEVAPPSISSSTSIPTLLAGNATPSMPSLSAPSPGSSGPLKVSSAAISDHLIRRVEPQYPDIARRSGLSGAVRLRLDVGADGKVKSVTILDGPQVLANAAKEAVLQWRYRPYVVDNRPSAIETEIIVRFTASR